MTSGGLSHGPTLCFSGESGSGKTEATKLILSYLAAVSQKRTTAPQVECCPGDIPESPCSPSSSPTSLFHPSSRLCCSLLVPMLPPGPWQIEVLRGHMGWAGSGGQRIMWHLGHGTPAAGERQEGQQKISACTEMDSLCSLTSSFNLAVVHTSNLDTHGCWHGAWGGCEGGRVTKGALALEMSRGVSGAQADPPSSSHHHDRSWRRPLCWNPSATPKL